jgi:hypothetical protein
VSSGGFWWLLVSSDVVLVSYGGFWWDLVSSGAVLVRFGVVLVGSGELWCSSG